MSSEKPLWMLKTWNPRLVKTPMPTMSATAIAVAVKAVMPTTACPVGRGVPKSSVLVITA